MPTLKHDITSRFAARKVYGRSGDAVTVISRSGHVLVVEGPDRFRYSITDNDLNERLPDAVDPPAYLPPAPPRPIQLVQPDMPLQKKTPSKRSAPPTPKDQGSLFA